MTQNTLKSQPLYIPPAEQVTIDQLKHRVDTVKDLAVTETKQVVEQVYEQNVTRAALIAVGVVVVAASVAYYLGTRAARRSTNADYLA